MESMVTQQMAQLDQQIPKNHPMRSQAEAQIKAQQKDPKQMKKELEERLKSDDVEVEVPLTLEECFRGVEGKVFDGYERLVICRGCSSQADKQFKNEDFCAKCGRCPPETREIPKMQGPFMVGTTKQEVE